MKSPTLNEVFMWLVFAVTFFYFLPFLVGLFRAHPHPVLLLASNAGLGWTGWGWVVSFVYALWTFAGASEVSSVKPLNEHDGDHDPDGLCEVEERRLQKIRLRKGGPGCVIQFPGSKASAVVGRLVR